MNDEIFGAALSAASLWEYVLELRMDDKNTEVAKAFEHHGTGEVRGVVVSVADEVDNAWNELDNEESGVACNDLFIPFDWAFVPWIVDNYLNFNPLGWSTIPRGKELAEKLVAANKEKQQ